MRLLLRRSKSRGGGSRVELTVRTDRTGEGLTPGCFRADEILLGILRHRAPRICRQRARDEPEVAAFGRREAWIAGTSVRLDPVLIRSPPARP